MALGVVALVAAIVALPVWSSAAGGVERAPRPKAPVLSFRRVPAFTAKLAGDSRLRAVLDRTLDSSGMSACLIVQDGPRAVYRRDPARPLVPASNMKVLTALVVLDRFGPEFRYDTEVRGPAPSDGVVRGDLWFVGSGDPLLATGDYAAVGGYERRPRLATPLETLADRVVAAGVRRVEGRIVGDESRYDRQRYVPTWKPGYITASEIGPASALTVNSGFVQWNPNLVPAPAPAFSAAAVLAALLQARGVTLGGAGEGTAPKGEAKVASIESPPISEVVAEMLQQSDNYAAEVMVKELGVRFGTGGTTEQGLAVVRDDLRTRGLPVDQMTALDGSGLDRGDRATCELLVGALDRGGEHTPLDNGLPVAGRDGTLARRFVGSPVAGRLRAKTGSLEGVAGLTGRAAAAMGTLTFSLLLNNVPSEAAGRAVQDRVAAALVAYPQGPTPDELAVA